MVYKLTRRRRRKTKKNKQKRLRGGSIPDKCIFIRFIRSDGLGNRLFIYGVALVISKETGHKICIIESANSNPHSKTDYNNLYSDVHFVKEGDVKSRLDKAKELYRGEVFGELNKDEYMKDTSVDYLLQASCQNYTFVHKVLPDMRKMLIDNEFHKESYKPLKDKINQIHSAFMHVRRGDYIKEGWVLPDEYYCNGLKELEKNAGIKHIYVVSDDLAWCKEQKEKWASCAPTKTIEILEDLNELQTLYAMMLSKAGAVISNSTFSAWGGMLGPEENAHSVLIYPKQWIEMFTEIVGGNPLFFSDRWTGINSAKQKGGNSFIPKHKFSFISYGNDTFKQSKERIKKEAEAMGCFNGGIKIYGPEDLSEEFKKTNGEYLKAPRGAGYWLWRPFIMKDMLSKMNDNDILLFADAGCTLQTAGLPRLYDYTNMISPESGHSVLVMRLKDGASHGGKGAFLAKKWTIKEIFDYFGVPADGEIANTNQIMGGFQMYRKCPESLSVVEELLKIAMTHPSLFSDDYNYRNTMLNKYFKENRHDQALLSIIVQKDPFKKFCKIIDDEIEFAHATENSEKIKSSSPVLATKIRN